MVLYAIFALCGLATVATLFFLASGIYSFYQRKLKIRRRSIANRKLSLVVESRQDITPSHFLISVSSPSGKRLPAFAPGQYLRLLVGDKGLERRYSLAEWQKSPKRYVLGIKKEHQGKGSTWLHTHAKVGATLDIYPPAGEFVLNSKVSKKVILIGGGIGITPMRAMLHKLATLRSKPEVWLFHSAKTKDELLCYDEFADYKTHHHWFNYLPYCSSPPEAWQGNTGRIKGADIAKIVGSLNDCDIYICAQQQMIEQLTTAFVEQGASSGAIHSELFGLGANVAATGTFDVEVQGKGSFVFNNHPSLIAMLEDNQIAINADCRTGECGKCKVKLLSGDIEYRVKLKQVSSSDEVLTCCAIPRSDISLAIL